MAEDAGDDDVEELREQDRFLPIANINRIVKSRLPCNAKVAKESKETIQVCGTASPLQKCYCRVLLVWAVCGVENAKTSGAWEHKSDFEYFEVPVSRQGLVGYT